MVNPLFLWPFSSPSTVIPPWFHVAPAASSKDRSAIPPMLGPQWNPLKNIKNGLLNIWIALHVNIAFSNMIAWKYWKSVENRGNLDRLWQSLAPFGRWHRRWHRRAPVSALGVLSESHVIVHHRKESKSHELDLRMPYICSVSYVGHESLRVHQWVYMFIWFNMIQYVIVPKSSVLHLQKKHFGST